MRDGFNINNEQFNDHLKSTNDHLKWLETQMYKASNLPPELFERTQLGTPYFDTSNEIEEKQQAHNAYMKLVDIAALYYEYQTEAYDLTLFGAVSQEDGRARLTAGTAQATERAYKLRRVIESVLSITPGSEALKDFNYALDRYGRMSFREVEQLYKKRYEIGEFKLFEDAYYK